MNRLRTRNQRGFTMIELMVVVVIVGILAAIAVPLYGKYIDNARTTEATGRIGEIVTAAKAWAQEHPNGAGVAMWPSGDDGVFDISTSTQNFDYTIDSGGGTEATGPFAIKATGINKMAGTDITVSVPNINSSGDPPVITGL